MFSESVPATLTDAARDAARVGWHVGTELNHSLVAVNPTNSDDSWWYESETNTWHNGEYVSTTIPLCDHYHP